MKAALAIFATAWAMSVVRAVLVFVLPSVHCFLRPDEARNLRFCDVTDIGVSLRARYPSAFGIVWVVKPKARRLRSHAQIQHVF